MFSSTAFQTRSASTPGRKPKQPTEGDEPGKKPKKVNSEIRKQQNRIASRNYREKRKRKLQYLQQLLKDGDSSDEHSGQPSEDVPGSRMLSPEYRSQRPVVTTITLPSTPIFTTLASTSGNAIDPVLAVTCSSYDNQLLRTSQPFPTFEPAWNASMYDPPPPVNISAWNVPSWMPPVDFSTPLSSRSQDFQFTPPPSHHSFEQLPTPPQQHLELVPSSDLFVVGSYGHCRRHPNQQPCTTDLSERSTSPYHQPRYRRAP